MALLHAIIAVCAAFDLAAGAYDAHETNVGIKKGSGLEADVVINLLSGSTATRKPSPVAVVAYNLIKTGAITSLFLTGNPALIGATFGGLIADGASHIQQGLKWRYLNNGGQIDRAKAYTWWQKLLGMGWD